ncbi:MAG: hypothetical protein OXF23_05190 [Candidatus Dadabacteria bacterium]|nr:hypothetical protein [Candidatus Dadabacteria bacterium]
MKTEQTFHLRYLNPSLGITRNLALAEALTFIASQDGNKKYNLFRESINCKKYKDEISSYGYESTDRFCKVFAFYVRIGDLIEPSSFICFNGGLLDPSLRLEDLEAHDWCVQLW